MTEPIRVEFDDSNVVAALDRVIAAGGDLEPVLRSIGEELVESTIGRFGSEVAPDGSRWAPNSQATIERYLAKHSRGGRGSAVGRKKVLRDEGFLADDSISYLVTGNELLIGSDRIQAATMQIGANKGEFGRDSRNRPIPWGAIPARPFLGLSDADEAAILDIVDEYLSGGA